MAVDSLDFQTLLEQSMEELRFFAGVIINTFLYQVAFSVSGRELVHRQSAQGSVSLVHHGVTYR